MLYERRIDPAASHSVSAVDDDAAIRISQSERAVMDVDLGAISHNLAVVRQLCPESRVLAIIKGDAYGVGAESVAAALQRAGAEGFGVDNVGEGIALRASGIRRKIVVLDGCVPENAALAVRYDLTPGIASARLLRAYDDAAANAGRELPVWLHYNCGFNRSGHRSHEEFRELVRALRDFKALRATTVYSHLPASHMDAVCTEQQTAEYETALAVARDELGLPLESSLLASHGILARNPAERSDWVRPGIILYGSACFERDTLTDVIAARVSQLRPALTLRARLLHKLRFRSAQHCGLGQKYAVNAGQTLGTVAIGFGNGLPLPSLSRHADFTFGTHRCPLVTVGMDYSQVDLTQHRKTPDLYEWMTLFGDPALGHQSLGEFAAGLEMSAWVLMRQLRVVKRYSDAGADRPVLG